MPMPVERKFRLASGRPARSRVFAFPPTLYLRQYTFFLPRVTKGPWPVGEMIGPRFQFFGRVSVPRLLAFAIAALLLKGLPGDGPLFTYFEGPVFLPKRLSRGPALNGRG